MKDIKKLILAFTVMLMGMLPAYSQMTEEEIEALLTREVEVENPVYMPVLGVGIGYFNFYGNVNDDFRSHTVGKPGVRVNLSTYLDRKNHYFRGNFYFMTGELSGTQRTVTGANTDTSRYNNLNFKSNIFSFGANVHYSFKPLIKGRFFEPFISAGIEAINFDSKADYGYGGNKPYHYWPDGTIRDAAWDEINPVGNIISRDYDYDINLRKENQSGLGAYSQFTLAIPVDVGIDFNVSKRVTLRAATSLHYTFTDLIDDLSAKANNPDLPDYKGKGKNNMYTYTYLSLHVDLFSPPRTITEDLLMLSLSADDYDMTMYEDQDDDDVLDRVDLCPDTPPTVEVDSVGCPFDTDRDGVPDYIDREPNSRPGAIVDEYGVEINENMVVEVLNAQAIRRSDVESYLRMHRMQNKARRGESLPIPDKFKRSDGNRDGYISFDELLKSINDFFDDISPYSPADINELIDFFFEQ